MPDIRPAAEPAAIEKVAGDPDFIGANGRFLDAWLIGNRYDEAMRFFSPRSYPCVDLYLNPGQPAAGTAGEQRARLRAGLERIGEGAGAVKRLEDLIQGVGPADPRVRAVDHARPQAVALMALPDWAGPVTECEARLKHRRSLTRLAAGPIAPGPARAPPHGGAEVEWNDLEPKP